MLVNGKEKLVNVRLAEATIEKFVSMLLDVPAPILLAVTVVLPAKVAWAQKAATEVPQITTF